ncbi:MAG TPA: flavin reductase family protein [Anaerolineales bacterium]|nr:flavin reductase family protein [Anaerolineales bacterium]
MEADPTTMPWKSVYKLMIGSIVPRPIGWISTVDAAGRPNLAPFSFFNAVASRPPTVVFCTTVREVDAGPKDTLRNVRATGEFVVNIVTEALAEAMNVTSTEFPPEVDEFQAAGLTATPSTAVTPPRVAESPIHFECRVQQIVELGAEPGGGALVLGRIVHLHVAESVLGEGDRIDLAALRPIGRLAGAAYCRVSDVFQMPRPKSQLGR